MNVTLIKQEPRIQSLPTHGNTALWLLTVTAVVTDNLGAADSNIFVYQASPRLGLGDRFAAVASAAQMLDLPAVKDGGSYYRHNMAVLLCRSAAELSAVWQGLQDDARLLVADWSKLAAASTSDLAFITPGQAVEAIADEADRQVRAVFSADFSMIEFYNAAGVKIGEQLITRSI